jgi:hypothetical protein
VHCSARRSSRCFFLWQSSLLCAHPHGPWVAFLCVLTLIIRISPPSNAHCHGAPPCGLHTALLRATFLHVCFILFDCCVCTMLTVAPPHGASCRDAPPRHTPLHSPCPPNTFDCCVSGRGVEMPLKCITTMLLVCRQALHVVIVEACVGRLLCAHRDVFPGWRGVVLGRCEGCGSGGNNDIWPW